ncbi:hypothetical protein LCGC14_0507380 [marine sediment metagenome]|uniref:N4-gp56 family major capsid protein n=1 Tax=marine sediment metagenome TaxID=412755 RepID=A0A0F9S291_9ZZZZ
MTITQLSTLPNSLRVRHLNDYLMGAMRRRFYDQVASPIDELSAAAGAANDMAELSRGGTVRITFISDMGITTTPLSEVQDIAPQTLADTSTDILVDMYGDGIQTSQKALIEYFTNYGVSSPAKVGLNMMETVDFKAMEAALGGDLVFRQQVRNKLDAGTTADRASDSDFSQVAARLSQFNTPGWEGENRPMNWVGLTDHFVVNDIAQGGNVVNVAIYQDQEMVLNNEIGRLHQIKIVASGFAKIFLGAGTVNTSAVATTITTAVGRLARTVVLGSTANVVVGKWLNIWNAEETGSTFYPDNERVMVASLPGGTTVTFVGSADNGGLRFAQAAGRTVNNADSVHTILFGGPSSVAKIYAPSVNEFGTLVGPKLQGLAEQWTSFAWKWFGGYGIPSQNWIHRGEFSVSEEA